MKIIYRNILICEIQRNLICCYAYYEDGLFFQLIRVLLRRYVGCYMRHSTSFTGVTMRKFNFRYMCSFVLSVLVPFAVPTL
jgi:hypothetical protein